MTRGLMTRAPNIAEKAREPRSMGRPKRAMDSQPQSGLGQTIVTSPVLQARGAAIQGAFGQALQRRSLIGPASAQNRTGMPDGLKANLEAMSGFAMDDVRVHRNSTKPAQLQALAYTQGAHIHLGPGQERHLPHEAWHVVQQKQGRVKPTLQMKGVAINDNDGLEREATVMGSRAGSFHGFESPASRASTFAEPVMQLKLERELLNVAGETHTDKDNEHREQEKAFCLSKTGSKNYWIENQFPLPELKQQPTTASATASSNAKRPFADPYLLRLRTFAAYIEQDTKDIRTCAEIIFGLKKLVDAPFFSLRKAVKSIKDSHASISAMIDRWAKGVDGFELHPWKSAYTKPFSDNLKSVENSSAAVLAAARKVYAQLSGTVPNVGAAAAPNSGAAAAPAGDPIEELKGVLIELETHSDNLKKTGIPKEAVVIVPAYFEQVAGMGKNEVVKARSKAMLEAANASRTSRGVWMIGDRHVSDMAEMKEEKAFNLVKETDFNTEFEEWKRAPKGTSNAPQGTSNLLEQYMAMAGGAAPVTTANAAGDKANASKPVDKSKGGSGPGGKSDCTIM